jgi:recombination protein RecA
MPTKAETARLKFLESMGKSYGTNALTVAADVTKPPAISTGALSLDYAMGSGGWLLGRIGQLWGPPGGGKTTLAYITVAEAQRTYPDKIAGFIDVEGTFDKSYAESWGVDTNRLDVFAPPSAEDVADIMKDMLQSDQYSIIVLDSIGAMLPEEEFEKSAGDATVGTIAKIITRMVKIAAVYARKHGVFVLIINQVRANIGYGADTTQGGGWALKHVCSWLMQVKRASSAYTIGTNDKKINVGYKMAVKIEKNKTSTEGRNVQFDIYTIPTEKYGPVGINKVQDAVAVGLLSGAIIQGGAYYTVPGFEKIKSREALEAAAAADPKMMQAIRDAVMARATVFDDDPVGPDLSVLDAIPDEPADVKVDTRRSAK